VRDPVRIILWVLALLAAGLTALGLGDRLGFGGRPGWVLDLVAHWPKHVFLLALLAAALAGWRRMVAAAGIASAAAATSLALVLGLGGFALPQAAPADARLVRVVSANVHGSMAALEQLALQAKSYGADIVSAHEVPDDLTTDDIARLFPDLRDREMPSVGRHELKLIRRSMLAAREADAIAYTPFPGSHGVIMRAQIDGVQLVTTHPPSPGDPGLKGDRDLQLGQLADGLDASRPFIIAGDFNTTPWGRAYQSTPGIRAGDPRFDGTFPAFAGWLGLPIDHVKFGGGLTLTDYRAGPSIGSDHLPLFATFALPAGALPQS
jgi:endonuclease/exonuclease/phosphatase (EEP) superfamily protein YafD